MKDLKHISAIIFDLDDTLIRTTVADKLAFGYLADYVGNHHSLEMDSTSLLRTLEGLRNKLQSREMSTDNIENLLAEFGIKTSPYLVKTQK